MNAWMDGWSEILNLGFALFFGAFVLFGIREAMRAYWPIHKERLQAQTRKADAEAMLAEATAQNQRELIVLTDRNTQMNSANTQAISQLAQLGSDTNHHVLAVYKHLLSGCKCESQDS